MAPIQSCGGSSCVCGALVLLGPWRETKSMHQNPPWEEGASVFIHQFSEKPWFLTSMCCQRLRKPWGRKEGALLPGGSSGALGLWMGRQVLRGCLWDTDSSKKVPLEMLRGIHEEMPTSTTQNMNTKFQWEVKQETVTWRPNVFGHFQYKLFQSSFFSKNPLQGRHLYL